MSITKQEMVDALREANKLGYLGGAGGGGGMGGGGGTTPSVGSDKLSREFEAAGGAARGVGSAFLGVGSKIAEGGAKLGDVTKALSEGFAGLGASGSILGTALENGAKGLDSLGQNLDQNINTWRKLSDTGLSFGNDIMAMKDQASGARLSIAEMSEVLQKNNSTMLGFGATSADSAKKLSAMSNEFFTSGLGEQLRGMGYTTKELNEVMAVSITGNRLRDIQEGAGQDRALKAAASLATEMDAVAKITGKSKEAQLDELRRLEADGQRQAARDLAIAKGGEGAAEAFKAVSANAGLAGPQFEKLAMDMATMGRPSEGMEQAYGLLSDGAKQTLNEMAAAANRGDRDEAARLAKRAAAEQAQFTRTEQYQTMAAKSGIKEFSTMYNETGKLANALKDANGNIDNVDESMKKLDEQVKKEQQAGGKDDPNASAGASITRFAVDIESRGRDLTKTINDQLIQPLAKDIGPKIKEVGKTLGITAQKGEGQISEKDQKKIDAEKDPATKAALQAAAQSAADNRKAASMIDKDVGKPIAASREISRADRVAREQAVDQGMQSTDKSAPELEKFLKLINGTMSSVAAEKLQSMAADKKTSVESLVTDAMKNKGAGLADINKAIIGEAKPGLQKDIMNRELAGERTDPRLGIVANQREGTNPSPVLDSVGKGIESLGALFRDGKAKVEIVRGSPTPAATPAPAPTAEVPARERRAGGSLEMAGKMFEDWGKGTMVELHGLEGVMRPQDISKVIESAMGGVRKTMPKIDMAGTDKAMHKFEMPKFEMPTMGKDKDFASLAAELSKMGKPDMSKLDLSTMSKTISTSISSVTGGKETAVKAPDMREMSNSMAKMGMKDDQKKIFDEMMTLNDQQSKEKLASLKEETAAAYAANKASSAAIDAMEEKLEAEGRHIKDLTAEERKKYDELRTQQNESYDNINKSIAATKAAEHAEKQKQSLQKLGYDIVVKQEEDKVTIVEDNSEKIKADISDALPVKEMAAKQEEFHSQFTESQQKIIDDYKGYSEENRSFHAQAMEAGVKEDTETALMIGARISKMKADIGDRQATEEEQKALENEEANKKMFEQQVEKKKEMLDVMQNLGDYSAKRELELKQKAANEAITIEDKKAEAIKADISAALPVDTEFGDLDGAIAKNKADDEIAAMEKQTAILRMKAAGIDVEAMEAEAEKERQAAWDSAVPDRLDAETMPPKKSIGDMMAGLDVGANGMPIMRSIDSAKQTLTQKTPSPGKKINPETGTEYTPVEELEKQQGKKTTTEKKSESKAAGKEATLSDVVTALNTLNTKMAQLIEVNETGHKSTANATKSNAGNIYAR